jgi:DNA polymerase-1
MKRFVIIDGNSLLFRAYFASIYGGPPMMTKDGTPTNAVFVFANMLAKVMQHFGKTTYCLVAFDTGEKTFRHEALETYKAHRKPAPVDLVKQFPIAREMLKALGIFTFEQSGFEGDDVAGTAAVIASKLGFEVELFTSDRDFLQLVSPNIHVQIIKKGVSDIVKMNAELVYETYGYHPHQVADYKGLVGDASDNIPGIPGIGEKTALKLLNKYQTLENIIAHADEIGGKIVENIKAHVEIGKLSKQLAIIDTTMTLPFTIEDTLYQGVHSNLLQSFIQKYEMKSLLNKFSPSDTLQKTSPIPTFQIVSLLPDVGVVKKISVIPSYQEGNYFKAKLLGFALIINDLHVYIPLEDALLDRQLLSLLSDPTVTKLTYDYKALMIIASLHHIDVQGPTFDVMIAAQTIEESSTFHKKQFFVDHDIELSVDPVAASFQVAHALNDLEASLKTQLEEKQLMTIIDTIEFPLIPVLAKMELEGVPFDVSMVSVLEKEVIAKLSQLQEEIYAHAGSSFNIDSPKQVSQVLFEQLQLPNYKKGSTNVDVLKSLVQKHPIIEPLLQYRKYAKLLSTYIQALPQHVYQDQKLHPIYHQAQTTTGRLSSFDPNIQNISVKDEETKVIRKAFYYQDPNYVWLSFDYSQIELRILAELSQCAPLIEVFHHDLDIHSATAEKLFSKDGMMVPQARRLAKAVNFGIIYGISSWGLAEQLQIAPQEASLLIDQFYAAYPELKVYMQTLISTLKTDKFVSTLLGRRRYLRDISGSNFQAREFAKRAAMNAPIQGTAADLIKLAMIQVDQFLTSHPYQTKLMLTIHDELIFKAHVDELKTIMPQIQAIMEHAMPLKVKLKVEGNYASNWHDLK